MSGETVGSIVSVRTGRVRQLAMPAWDRTGEASWSSAFIKGEREGAVSVGALGMEGDEQADRVHHGGPEMAVLMYAAAHYETWRGEPGLEAMGPGGLGENLTVSSLDETNVCVGDVLEVGGCVLQIASPRAPCNSISRRWNNAALLRRVTERLWTGWYLRVLEEGNVQVGDSITLRQRLHADWSVHSLLALRLRTPRDPARLAHAQTLEAMSAEWHNYFAKLALKHA